MRRAGGPLDAAIVLGSGLGDAARARIDGVAVPFAKLHAPVTRAGGHAATAYVGAWSGKRVAAFAGRAHLYDGYDARDVTYAVRLAAAAGAKTIVLTNAAGGLDPRFVRGDIMLIADHINMTGTTPLEGPRFIDMTDAYAPHLRRLARDHAGDLPLHEGVYAGVRGPHYETPAEAQALRRLGAHAVGMSTVLETIAARALRLDVLGISLIANAVAPDANVSHDDVIAASAESAGRMASLIEGVLAAM